MAGPYWYYLGHHPWTVDQDGQGRYALPPACVAAVDLRTLPDQAVAGVEREPSFFAAAQPLDAAYYSLGHGDCREIAATDKLRDLWQAITGFRPQGDRLVDLLADHLTRGSDPAGDSACRPLMPNTAGALEIYLAGHSRVWTRPMAWGRDPHTAKVRDVYVADLAALGQQARQGTCRTPDFHRQRLKAVCEKLSRCGITEDEAEADLLDTLTRLPVAQRWGKSEKRLPHSTTIHDDFNRADSAILGAAAEGWMWSEIQGDWAIVGNRAAQTAISGRARARADFDLASDDHYAEIDWHAEPDSADLGVVIRKDASSTLTYYSADAYDAVSRLTLYKTIANTLTSLGTATYLPTQGERLRSEIDGSALDFLMAGVSRLTATDTAITGHLRCGLYSFYARGRIDNFEAGDLAAPDLGDILGRFDSPLRSAIVQGA